jgi:hypothetical protein
MCTLFVFLTCICTHFFMVLVKLTYTAVSLNFLDHQRYIFCPPAISEDADILAELQFTHAHLCTYKKSVLHLLQHLKIL